jgi:hypothetical protein
MLGNQVPQRRAEDVIVNEVLAEVPANRKGPNEFDALALFSLFNGRRRRRSAFNSCAATESAQSRTGAQGRGSRWCISGSSSGAARMPASHLTRAFFYPSRLHNLPTLRVLQQSKRKSAPKAAAAIAR